MWSFLGGLASTTWKRMMRQQPLQRHTQQRMPVIITAISRLAATVYLPRNPLSCSQMIVAADPATGSLGAPFNAKNWLIGG